MKYRTLQVNFHDEDVWVVYENATEQVIEAFVFEEDAAKMATFMENGGCFNGFTPSFFLIELPADILDAQLESL